MPSARAFIASTLVFAVVAVVGVGAFNAWIDPLMQYRVPSYQPRFVTGFARHIIAGLARNLEYDSVVVGSSYAMNFHNSDFDGEFGGRTVSFAMPGMFVSEGGKVLTYAFSLKPLKRIFFGLDFFAFVDSDNHYQFPDYLYDARWTNDGPYLLSLDTLKRSLYIVLDLGPNNFVTDQDMPWSWAKGLRLGQDRALADYAKKRNQRTAAASSPSPLNEMERVAREQIASLVAQHPETEFEFFLPPYSALAWILSAEHGDLAMLLRFRIFLAKLVAQYSNARLHDFQALQSLICDLDHYVDIGHYGPKDNRKMVSAMRRGKYVVTPDTVSANNNVIEEIVIGRCSGTIPTGHLRAS